MKQNIGLFFAITKGLTRQNEECSGCFPYTEEEKTKILDFIKNDFSDYCHYDKKNLDLEKYSKLILKDI